MPFAKWLGSFSHQEKGYIFPPLNSESKYMPFFGQWNVNHEIEKVHVLFHAWASLLEDEGHMGNSCCILICCDYLLHSITVMVKDTISILFYMFYALEIYLPTKTKYFYFKWIESTFLYLSVLDSPSEASWKGKNLSLL